MGIVIYNITQMQFKGSFLEIKRNSDGKVDLEEVS